MTLQRGQFDFAVDLPFGTEGERLTRELLRGVIGDGSALTVEVKRDARALSTGRVYLEYEQQPYGVGPWVRSGLAITKADYFAVVVGTTVIFASVPAWRYVGNLYGQNVDTGGSNPTRGRVVPLASLIERLAEAPF